MSEPTEATQDLALPTPEEFDALPLHHQADLLERVQQRLAERLDASAS
ncbi:hypothetical protein [Serinibacter salmoneus]|uniref:Uncharacterized protein n=1 Tax=Serinibacter salmoneus TaxID=556530 RepID=A0A2A9CYE2_9MICO|nr:hypothetical protein [Serinibacter salmoneus]PFG19447.1 hypothetical protein ATL40_1010 [Serinibacter salmoneus]